jgi:hypothetical protein
MVPSRLLPGEPTAVALPVDSHPLLFNLEEI